MSTTGPSEVLEEAMDLLGRLENENQGSENIFPARLPTGRLV